MTNPQSLKTLYCAYVRPHLEYGSVVWSPHQTTFKEELQKVQTKFLRMVGVRNGFNFEEVPIEELQSFLGLQSLEVRRKMQDVMFLYKILNNFINAPELLQRIFFRCPGRTRSQELFGRRHHSTNYVANSTMERIQTLGNVISPHVDFFADGPEAFKKTVFRVLSLQQARPDAQ